MNQERHSQWLRGVLDMCVLALLTDGESYGYQLAQALAAAGLGTIRGGTLYPVLLRLQRTGLVAAQWREGRTGPARKYYRITDAGRVTLRDAVPGWWRFAEGVDTIVRRVAVG